MFLEKEFSDYIFIDLKKDDDARKAFENTCDPKKYIDYIESKYIKRISNECPLFIDEVQECPSVLTSLKYFNQDNPNLPIIVSGSLVRVKIKRIKNEDSFMFPTGKINQMYLRPLNFEEFLLNTNPILLEKIKDAYTNKIALDEPLHKLALESLHKYLTVGGMPEVLDTFLNSGSYLESDQTLKEIFDDYLADMELYNVSYETILKTRNVFMSVYSQLNKEHSDNKNYKISMIDSGKSNRDYFNAYEWLEFSNILYRCNVVKERVTTPLTEGNKGSFRYYLLDSGLFRYQSKVNQTDFFVESKKSTLSGTFYENYCACEFVNNEIPLFFWEGKQNHEFEFIVQYKGNVIPIDVKKNSGKLNSLEDFRNHNEKNIAIKISSNNFGYDANNMVLTIPL